MHRLYQASGEVVSAVLSKIDLAKLKSGSTVQRRDGAPIGNYETSFLLDTSLVKLAQLLSLATFERAQCANKCSFEAPLCKPVSWRVQVRVCLGTRPVNFASFV